MYLMSEKTIQEIRTINELSAAEWAAGAEAREARYWAQIERNS